MSPPKHILSAAAIVINDKMNYYLLEDHEEDGKCQAVKWKKENL